jgi:hypothetical protein
MLSGYSVFSDSAATIPLSGDSVVTLYNENVLANARIDVVRTSSQNPKTIYIKG